MGCPKFIIPFSEDVHHAVEKSPKEHIREQTAEDAILPYNLAFGEEILSVAHDAKHKQGLTSGEGRVDMNSSWKKRKRKTKQNEAKQNMSTTTNGDDI